jgi:hypothetical protein
VIRYGNRVRVSVEVEFRIVKEHEGSNAKKHTSRPLTYLKSLCDQSKNIFYSGKVLSHGFDALEVSYLRFETCGSNSFLLTIHVLG